MEVLTLMWWFSSIVHTSQFIITYLKLQAQEPSVLQDS